MKMTSHCKTCGKEIEPGALERWVSVRQRFYMCETSPFTWHVPLE